MCLKVFLVMQLVKDGYYQGIVYKVASTVLCEDECYDQFGQFENEVGDQNYKRTDEMFGRESEGVFVGLVANRVTFLCVELNLDSS